MNHLRYRLETLPAALNAWKMPRKSVPSFKGRNRIVLFVVAGVLVVGRACPGIQTACGHHGGPWAIHTAD